MTGHNVTVTGDNNVVLNNVLLPGFTLTVTGSNDVVESNTILSGSDANGKNGNFSVLTSNNTVIGNSADYIGFDSTASRCAPAHASPLASFLLLTPSSLPATS